MNIYHWITLISLADIALILFVRGADERRGERAQNIKRMEKA